MTTQHIGFSILSAPIAATDRRALSQAWYSALHLAHERPAAPGQLARKAQVPALASSPRPALGGVALRPLPRASARPITPPRVVRPEGAGERRAARLLLARRIERELLCPSHPANRATFAVGGSAARVHVTLQRERNGLRLVAVCSPRVRAVVARALEQARFALARRGIELGLALRES